MSGAGQGYGRGYAPRNVQVARYGDRPRGTSQKIPGYDANVAYGRNQGRGYYGPAPAPYKSNAYGGAGRPSAGIDRSLQLYGTYGSNNNPARVRAYGDETLGGTIPSYARTRGSGSGYSVQRRGTSSISNYGK